MLKAKPPRKFTKQHPVRRGYRGSVYATHFIALARREHRMGMEKLRAGLPAEAFRHFVTRDFHIQNARSYRPKKRRL